MGGKRGLGGIVSHVSDRSLGRLKSIDTSFTSRLPWIFLGSIAFAVLISACGGGGTTVAFDTTIVDGGGGVAGPEGGDPSGGGTTAEGAGQEANVGVVSVNDPNDNDQDGITDGDNCLGVFNPDQADDDGDGIGNPCEAEPLPDSPCGFDGSLTTEASGSGDTSVTTLCLPSIGAPPPAWAQLGEVLVVDETYLLIDLTDAELAEARGLGLETTVVDSVAGRSPADLAELRIQRSPESALDTADPDVLSGVRPEAFEAVPADALAAQPDETLAAIPQQFWIDAPQSTIDAVGESRLDRIDPNIPRFESGLSVDEKLAPSAALNPSTTTSSTATTATSTTTTLPPVPEGQDPSDG